MWIIRANGATRTRTTLGRGRIARSTALKGPSLPSPTAGSFFSFLLFNSSAQYAVGVCNDINKYRSRLPYMASDRVPYCNTSASVRRTEELIAQLITETRSQLNCNCIESCTKACTPNGENSIPGKLDFILVLCVFVCVCGFRLFTCTRASRTLWKSTTAGSKYYTIMFIQS